MSERDCKHGNLGRVCQVCELEQQLAAEKASHAETWKLLVKTMEQRDAMESGLKGLACGLLAIAQCGDCEKGEVGDTDKHGPARTCTDVECWDGGDVREVGHGE